MLRRVRSSNKRTMCSITHPPILPIKTSSFSLRPKILRTTKSKLPSNLPMARPKAMRNCKMTNPKLRSKESLLKQTINQTIAKMWNRRMPNSKPPTPRSTTMTIKNKTSSQNRMQPTLLTIKAKLMLKMMLL